MWGSSMTSADEPHDLDLRAFTNRGRFPRRLAHDFAIEFHRDPRRVDLQETQQC